MRPDHPDVAQSLKNYAALLRKTGRDDEAVTLGGPRQSDPRQARRGKSMRRARRSMLAMMETEEKDYVAHPMFWAPFVVVGEGGTPM